MTQRYVVTIGDGNKDVHAHIVASLEAAEELVLTQIKFKYPKEFGNCLDLKQVAAVVGELNLHHLVAMVDETVYLYEADLYMEWGEEGTEGVDLCFDSGSRCTYLMPHDQGDLLAIVEATRDVIQRFITKGLPIGSKVGPTDYEG